MVAVAQGGKPGASYTAVHVVSDLHLNGDPNHQIFKGAKELAALIDRLGTEHRDPTQAERRIAFVINGDFIDFLAAPKATYFDPEGAIGKLDAVIEQFPGIWNALRSFVSKPGNDLIISLGNHDLELALSDVKRHLVETIAQKSPEAAGRIHLAMDGEGFACRVGDKTVICVHGNEVDTFNVVDHEKLRQIDRDRQMRWEVDPWVPNAGTKLVIDIMNGIKRDLPFVDLLKPETQAVVPILFALDQASRERLGSAIGVGGRLAWDKIRRWTGFLSDEDAPGGQPEPRGSREPSYEALIAAALARTGATQSTKHATDELLLRTEELFRKGVDPLHLVGEQQGGTLGYPSALWKALEGREKAEVLREALESVRKDRSFDRSAVDDTFKDLDEAISDKFDFIIAGHTHLERVLRRKRGRGTYMNTGTWARLIRLRPDDLISLENFRPIFEGLQSKTIESLERALPKQILHLPVVASVWLEGGVVKHELHRVTPDAANVKLNPVAAE